MSPLHEITHGTATPQLILSSISFLKIQVLDQPRPRDKPAPLNFDILWRNTTSASVTDITISREESLFIMSNNTASGSCSSHDTGCPGDSKLTWSSFDLELMRLFYADDWELAGLDKESSPALSILQDLDLLITSFEARIGHSDAGFDAWRCLHQTEMSAKRVPAATLCIKQCYSPKGPIWDDSKWETRYAWMVHNRQDIVNARLSQIKGHGYMLSSSISSFWGDDKVQPDRLRGPSIKRRIRQAKPIGNQWNKTIDSLLEQHAGRSGVHPEKLKRAFWATRYGKKPERFRPMLPVEIGETAAKPAGVKMEEDEGSIRMTEMEEDKENIVVVKVEQVDHRSLPFRERTG